MTDPYDIERQIEAVKAAIERGRHAQQEVNRILDAQLPTRWVWTPEETWEIQGKDCWIWMQARPQYCDRGNWLAHIEVKSRPFPHPVWLDGADGWPRYYFDLERAKAEVEAWLKKRKQWVENPQE